MVSSENYEGKDSDQNGRRKNEDKKRSSDLTIDILR